MCHFLNEMTCLIGPATLHCKQECERDRVSESISECERESE